MKAKDVIKRLLADGWLEIKPRKSGSHRHFKHPSKQGKVQVADHGAKDIPIKTLLNIEKQSGVSMR